MIFVCAKCGGVGSENHHLFEQTKMNRKLYGKLLDKPCNIQRLCYGCHHNKPVDHIDEVEFCRRVGISPRSKSGKMAALRLQSVRSCL